VVADVKGVNVGAAVVKREGVEREGVAREGAEKEGKVEVEEGAGEAVEPKGAKEEVVVAAGGAVEPNKEGLEEEREGVEKRDGVLPPKE
jgi:hypothetical protein